MEKKYYHFYITSGYVEVLALNPEDAIRKVTDERNNCRFLFTQPSKDRDGDDCFICLSAQGNPEEVK